MRNKELLKACPLRRGEQVVGEWSMHKGEYLRPETTYREDQCKAKQIGFVESDPRVLEFAVGCRVCWREIIGAKI